MSRLRLKNGDDHPEAARKHLRDAAVLLSQHRTDGAAYLSGYVVECALKSLQILEIGKAPPVHDLQSLARQVSLMAAIAGATSARYFGTVTAGVAASAIGGWTPQMRYHAPVMTAGDAEAWHACARAVFQETVHQMRLDGVL